MADYLIMVHMWMLVYEGVSEENPFYFFEIVKCPNEE